MSDMNPKKSDKAAEPEILAKKGKKMGGQGYRINDSIYINGAKDGCVKPNNYLELTDPDGNKYWVPGPPRDQM